MADEPTPIPAQPYRLTAKTLRELIEHPVEDLPPPVDITSPAFGQGGAPALGPEEDMLQQEATSYRWSRQNYHDFIERIRAADVDGPVAVNQLREYIMRQLVAYSGHPDAKTAIKALEMLGKVAQVNLFGEKRNEAPTGLTQEEKVRTELADILKTFKKA